MSVFSRFTDIVNANLNSLLERAEDPEKMIKLIIQEMDEALIDIRAVAAKHLAEKQTCQRSIKEHEKFLQQWQEKAELAIARDREDLAKQALFEKQYIQKNIDNIRNEFAEIELSLNTIQQDSQHLHEKIHDAKARQKTLLLRRQAASTRLALKAKTASDNIEATLAKFELYEQKVEQIEAQVAAYDITKNTSTTGDLAELESLAQAAVIDKELSAIREKLAS